MARDDWDKHWADYTYSNGLNPAQRYRQQVLTSLLDRPERPSANFLDIGSGTGTYIAMLDSLEPDWPKLGLEYSAQGVEMARKLVPNAVFHKIDLMKPVSELTEYKGWATRAVCSEVLEHVDDPVTLMRNAATFMASGCRLVVTVPGGPMSAFDLHIGHRQHFTPQSITAVLEQAGLKVDRAFGAGFPFFNLYRLLVIARGDALVVDSQGKPGILLKVMSTIFDVLMKFNVMRTTLGWQVVAIAHKV
jgi:SAM-dependent methyltransferase